MNMILLCIIEFVVAFALAYIYQILFVVNKYKKDLAKNKINEKNKRTKTPQELILFLNMTGLKEEDIDVFKVLKILIIVNSFDVGLVLLLTKLVSSLILKILIALVSILFIIIISYKILAFIYKKKGTR